MLTKLLENRVVSLLLLILRLYLGIWFLHHVIAQALYLPKAWLMMGSALKYFGINFFPELWGFIAVFFYVVGSLLLITGRWTRLGAASMATTMIVAANMHFSMGQGFTMAKPALMFLVLFLFLVCTGPGKYTLK